jgi:hypothetical protein
MVEGRAQARGAAVCSRRPPDPGSASDSRGFTRSQPSCQTELRITTGSVVFRAVVLATIDTTIACWLITSIAYWNT